MDSASSLLHVLKFDTVLNWYIKPKTVHINAIPSCDITEHASIRKPLRRVKYTCFALPHDENMSSRFLKYMAYSVGFTRIPAPVWPHPRVVIITLPNFLLPRFLQPLHGPHGLPSDKQAVYTPPDQHCDWPFLGSWIPSQFSTHPVGAFVPLIFALLSLTCLLTYLPTYCLVLYCFSAPK